MGAIALPEAVLVLLPQPAGAGEVGLALLLRAGELITFGLLLGLWWERRISIAGQVPWGAIRNLRNAGALSAPATAVAVATATTVATLLAGAATTGLLHAPAGQDTPSSVSTPAPEESPKPEH